MTNATRYLIVAFIFAGIFVLTYCDAQNTKAERTHQQEQQLEQQCKEKGGYLLRGTDNQYGYPTYLCLDKNAAVIPLWIML
jgi:hypothetical protein